MELPLLIKANGKDWVGKESNMSEETIFFVIMVLAFLCITGAIIIIFIAAMGGMVWGISRVFSKSGEALQAETGEYFAEIVPQLQSWKPDAPADFSSQLEIAGRSALGKLHYRGMVKSLGQSDSPGWLAFDLQLKFGKGPMLLRTANHALQLDFGGIGSRTVQVSVNEQPFGAIQEAAEVDLLDTQERQIGCYKQHRLALGASPSDYARTPYYGPVEIADCTLAELNRNPLLHKNLLGNEKISPLLQNIEPNLTLEEEHWLLALVGWEIYNRIITH